MKALEPNIVIRPTASGEARYIVRIRDVKESSGLFFNGTFKSLELARTIRDRELANQKNKI